MNAMSNAERQRLYRLRKKGKAPAPTRVAIPITQRETLDVTGLAAEWTSRNEWDRKALGDFLDLMRLWERASDETRAAFIDAAGIRGVGGNSPALSDEAMLQPGPLPASRFTPDEKLSALIDTAVGSAERSLSYVSGILNNPRSNAQKPHITEATRADHERGLALANELATDLRRLYGVPDEYVLMDEREGWYRGKDGVWRRYEPDETSET